MSKIKSAQEVLGILGTDKIKEIFNEELTEWEKQELLLWIQQNMAEFPDLGTTISLFSDFEVLDHIPVHSIIDYMLYSDKRAEEMKEAMPCLGYSDITTEDLFDEDIINKSNVLLVLQKIREEFPEEFELTANPELNYDSGFENGYDQALVDHNINPTKND